MISSIAKVYARNLSKEEALLLVKSNLDYKKEEIEKHGTNTKFKSFLGILISICAVIGWEITIVCTLIFGSVIGITLYIFGKKVNEKLSKDFEQSIPLYLYFQSTSFNYGICSLKEIYKQNINDKNSAAPPIKK